MSVDVNKSDVKKNIEAAEDGKVKKEKLYEAIGEMGPWQIFFMFLLAVPCKMSATWQMMGIIFLAPKTQYRCLSRRNFTEEMLINECFSDCDEYEYITEFQDSIITRFGLICEKAWLANLAQMMLMMGVLVGSMVFGFIADR